MGSDLIDFIGMVQIKVTLSWHNFSQKKCYPTSNAFEPCHFIKKMVRVKLNLTLRYFRTYALTNEFICKFKFLAAFFAVVI